MKVVLFCGGQGTRLREYSETIPKPLVNVGNRPILWHLMKYYAHYGHTEFVLCLGYRGDLVREFFLDYDPRRYDDFVMEQGNSTVLPNGSDTRDWSIEFVDTGQRSNIGERLMAVREHLRDEEMFFANYADQLSDLPLDQYLEGFQRSQATAGFLSVRPSQSFHLVEQDSAGLVTRLAPVVEFPIWINGGFIVLKNGIFDYMRPGEELVVEPFSRLLKEQLLYTQQYSGFWKALDTFKDKLGYDEMDAAGERAWEVWK
jgi:glucose-1-phosphate cytidylyltransferase